jgi:glycerophosphoryl diester phosphodiesterase
VIELDNRSRPLVLGHRGASAHATDNSIEAFELAVAHGADGVELDVRFTADEVVVLHHDADIGEMGPLIHYSFAELRASHPEIPTLDESLAVLADLIVNVEIKNSPRDPDYDPEHRMADFVAHWAAEHDIRQRVIVTSFNAATVAAVRRADATITTGQLTPPGFDIVEGTSAIAVAGHQWIAPWVGDVTRDADDAVAAAHQAGLRLAVWTVDEPSDIAVLAAANVDAIISNDPQASLRQLESGRSTPSS